MRFQVTAFTRMPVKHVPRAGFEFVSARYDGLAHASTPWISVTGRTADGVPVLVLVGGVEPYLYVDVGGDGERPLDDGEVSHFSAWLARAAEVTVTDISILAEKKSLIGAESVRVARIAVSNPNHVYKVADMWHQGRAHFGGRLLGTRVWEADVPLPMRLAVGINAVPYGWLDIADDDMCLLDGGGRCSLLAAVHYGDVCAVPLSAADGMNNAPLALLAFDIECVGEPGRVPKAELGDEVIMIGCVLYRNATLGLEADNVVERVAFIRGTEEPAPSDSIAYVMCDGEAALLCAFAAYVNQTQVDLMTGYNIDRFDWPFLLGRARANGCYDEFADIGRRQGVPIDVRQTQFESSARGKEDDNNIVMVGITNFDMLRWVRTTHKLRSYKLDAVVKKLLNPADGKVDVHYTEIPVLFAGSCDDRKRLAEYCVYDAELAGQLMLKQCVVPNQISMARVTGVDIHTLVTGGQGVKVHTQLLRFCRPRNILVPTRYRPRQEAAAADDDAAAVEPTVLERAFGARGARASAPQVKRPKRAPPAYEGAIVVEPRRAFYPDPITTLDFSSLYPSIIIEHNLCYSTLVRPGERCACGHAADTGDAVLACCVKETPIGVRVWRPHVREGVLPAILRNLLAERATAKKAMEACGLAAKDETRPEAERQAMRNMHTTWNCHQLSVKLSCNSIYGFTGAEVGKLPEMRISASVTAYGRDMITYIIGLVERMYRGCVPGIAPALDTVPLSALVVYGDTDSIMVRFGVDNVAQAMQIGRHAAAFINAAFRIRTLTSVEAAALLAEIAPAFATLEDALVAQPAVYVPLLLQRLVSAISILFEKVLFPYLLINKKRYCGNFYEKTSEVWDKLHQSGIESVRRDNAVYTADTVKTVIQRLMNTRDPLAALALARQAVRMLARNRVPLDALVISKALSRPAAAYANAASQPHLVVNARREQREPGSGYSLGDRVPYMFVLRAGQLPGRNPRSTDFVEDVDYVRKQGLRPWTEYYVNNQLRKPLTRIFDTIWGAGAADSLLFTADVVTATPPPPPAALRLFARPTPAATTADAEESLADMERRVRAWCQRPRADTSQPLMAAFAARAKEH